jgi:hypothetical protein
MPGTNKSDRWITLVNTRQLAIGAGPRSRFVEGRADVPNHADVPDDPRRCRHDRAVQASSAAAGCSQPPQSSHHVVDIGDNGLITGVTPMRDLRQWENGGYFLLRPEIFDYLNEGEDLVEDALVRLVPQGRVLAYPYKGYWSPADTVKERVQLEEMYHEGNCPWMVWDPERSGMARPAGGSTAAPTTACRQSEPRRGDPACATCISRRMGGPLPCSRLAHPLTIPRSCGGCAQSAELRGRGPLHRADRNQDRQQRGTAGPTPSCRARAWPSIYMTCRRAGCRRPGAR